LQDGARKQGRGWRERTLHSKILVLVLDNIIFKPEINNCQNLYEPAKQLESGRFDFSIAFCHGKKMLGINKSDLS
jgi:hypothetical protein